MKRDEQNSPGDKSIYSTIRANGGIVGTKKRQYYGRKILVILGPTAVGKSALAVKLARKLDGEIISADSRQVYTGLSIGTGKITQREMGGIPHHLLDITNPKKRMNVAEYQKIAKQKLEEVFAKGNLPIIVGGTGLYIQAIVNNVLFPEVPPNLALRKKLDTKSPAQLFAILKKMDARRAKTIDAHNPRRLVRAIEVASALGKVPPYANAPRGDLQPLFIGLTLPAKTLKEKIAIRLFARIGKGMIAEVKRLHRNGVSWKRMEELGLEYRYVSRYLRGLLTRKEMAKQLQSEIWHYAKRQFVWFKRDARIHWFRPTEEKKILKRVSEFLE